MKFFHVYNDDLFAGLEKNGLINKDSGFKIQHCFAMPEKIKFNSIAAKGGKLHSLIKNNNIAFYVDRIAGGVTYHQYDFDKELIKDYTDLLGDWFLGHCYNYHIHTISSIVQIWVRLLTNTELQY